MCLVIRAEPAWVTSNIGIEPKITDLITIDIDNSFHDFSKRFLL